MPTIETLQGVIKVSKNFYEVTELITIDDTIDDISSAYFLCKDGGYIRFGNGCNIVMEKCTIEESDTSRGGFFTPRFVNGSAPILKGCSWVCDINESRADFSISNGASPQFLRADDGTPCYIETVGGYFNKWLSTTIVIDGLIVNAIGANAPLEFNLPPSNFKDLTLVDNNIGSGSRHLVFLMNSWPDNTEQTLFNIKARNISCWQGNSTKIINLVNPFGELLKSFESSSNDGVLTNQRTYKSKIVDENNISKDVACVVYNVINDEIEVDTTTNELDVVLKRLIQPADSNSIILENEYTITYVKYGFLPLVKSITVEASQGTGIDDGFILMLKDPTITEIDPNVVSSYTSINTKTKLNDYVSYFNEFRLDRENLGKLSIGNNQLEINATATELFEFDTNIKIRSIFFEEDFSNKIILRNGSLVRNGNFGIIEVQDTDQDLVLSNGSCTELINNTGNDINLILDDFTVETLTETNGSFIIPSIATVTEVSELPFTLMACETGTSNVIYPPTENTIHSIDMSGYNGVTFTAFRAGKWVSSRKVTVSESINILFNLIDIPFYDSNIDIQYLKDSIENSVEIVTPSENSPFTSLIETTFTSSPGRILQPGHMRQLISDIHGQLPFLALFCRAGISGDKVFEMTSNGYKILQPVATIKVAESLDENIISLGFVENLGKEYTAGLQIPPFEPDFVHTPENTNNRALIYSKVPLILNSNIGVDSTSEDRLEGILVASLKAAENSEKSAQ